VALRPSSATLEIENGETSPTGRKKASSRERTRGRAETATEAAAKRKPEGSRVIQIPDRRYFRIGEVANLLGVRPHVLRYWETEFKEIRPQKSQRNQRLYRKRDVEVLVAIRKLLYEERFTIAGARDRVGELVAAGEVSSFSAPKVPLMRLELGRLEQVRDGLQDLMAVLDRRDADLEAVD